VQCSGGISCIAGANCAGSCLNASFVCTATTNAFTFPTGSVVPGLGFLALSQTSNFTFGLKSSENIRIFAQIGLSPDQSRDILAFGLDFSAHDSIHEMSGGRCPDGGDLWVGGMASTQMYPTIGGANNCTAPQVGVNLSGACWSQPVCTPKLAAGAVSATAAAINVSFSTTAASAPPAGTQPSPYRGKVVINEADHSGTPADWVELLNVWTGAIDLTGWIFRDNDDAHVFVLPAAPALAPGARLVLQGPGAADGFTFGLGTPSDAARLWDPSGLLVDSYYWYTSAGAGDWARCPDGTGNWTSSLCRTKGTTNACTSADAALCDADGLLAAAGNTSAAPPFPLQTANWTMAMPSAANAAGIVVPIEPSGGAWHPGNRSVWLAGDAGFVARMDRGGGNLRIWAVAGDMEGVAVTRADSPYVYLFNEDDGTVHEFDPTGSGATMRVFNLLAAAAAPGVPSLTDVDRDALVDAGPYNFGGDGTGGEALTFVPNPADAEGGVFWVGSQENCQIYRFRLPLVSGGTSAVFLGRFGDWPATDVDLASLEYDWASGKVLAIFDTQNLLRLIDPHTLSGNGMLLREWSALPGQDQEGLASDGSSLWIAQDGPGIVDRFDGFDGVRSSPAGTAGNGSCAGANLSCCTRRWSDPGSALHVDVGPGARVVSLEVFVDGQPDVGAGRFTAAHVAGLFVAAGADRGSLVPCSVMRLDVQSSGCGLLVRNVQCYAGGARAVGLRLPGLGAAPAGGAVMVHVCAQSGKDSVPELPRFPVSFNRCQ
jgi:hypothetical protein